MQRRKVISTGIAASAAWAVHQHSSTASAQDKPSEPALVTDLAATTRPTFIATWNFGKAACERALDVYLEKQSLRDAVERGINLTELDEKNRTVGYGGLPNANGVVQLDACFMDGKNQQAGSVAAIEGYPNPISVARRVMESTKHVMLAGKDAATFAEQNGFASRDMMTSGVKAAWEKWKANQKENEKQGLRELNASGDNHDTISLIGLDQEKNIVGGCSTSGLAYKLPGRVGDSPIIGSGLYVDGKVGGAGATGVGENILRYCGTFLVVEFMRQGMSPTDACAATIRRIADGDEKSPSELSVNFIAINRDGVVGAAGTDEGFRAAVVDTKSSQIVRPRWIRDA